MRKLIWSKTFLRASKKVVSRRPEFQKEIENTLRILVRDPFDPQLKTHKLKGKLSGTWACSVTHNYRIIFDFVKNEEGKEDDIFLIEIGTHDEVY